MKTTKMKPKSKKSKKVKEHSILNLLSFHLYNNNFHPTLMDNILDVCGTSNITITDKNELGISFEVDTDPTWAAGLTLECIKFGISIGFTINIYEPYALIFSDNGEEVVDILHGKEALHYHKTGEMPVNRKSNPLKKEKRNKVKLSTYDSQKKLDKILDKISKSGMDSLNKSQKEYLRKCSEEKPIPPSTGISYTEKTKKSISDILDFMYANRDDSSTWFVGITNACSKTLFESGKVDKENGIWIWRKIETIEAAQQIKLEFLRQKQFKMEDDQEHHNNPGGDVILYAYKK